MKYLGISDENNQYLLDLINGIEKLLFFTDAEDLRKTYTTINRESMGDAPVNISTKICPQIRLFKKIIS